MAVQLLYFITSLLVVGASVKVFSHLSRWKAVMLVAASVVYSIFCFMAFRLEIEQSEEMSILLQEFDASLIAMAVNLAFWGGILFNVVTSVWVWLRAGLWKWCLAMAAGFCVVCVGAGLVVGISPLIALFGGCCGFMAAVAFVLGLTYKEFCVIGNIWVPCAAIIGTAMFLIYASWRCIKSGKGDLRVLPVASSVLALIQIVGAIVLLFHYAGTFDEAFDRCRNDLLYLADIANTSYEAVNIFIWVFFIVAFLAYNIAAGRHLLKRSGDGEQIAA